MALTTSNSRLRFDWSVASRPKPGQAASGDLHLFKRVENVALMAVVDGLGHGDQAIAAARCAVEILDQHSTDPLITLVHRCHDALLRTRGVVMTLAAVQMTDGRMTWLGVGNVEGCVFRAKSSAYPASERVLQRSGVVGYQLPALHAGEVMLAPGDWLVFNTDGIRSGFTENLKLAAAPSVVVEQVLDRYFKGTDDALVLAARYLGKAHE